MFDDTTLLFENTWDFDEIYHLSRTNRVQDNVLYNLPDKFASKEFVKEVANNGLNMKTAYTWLNDLKEKGHIEKIAHGRYVKKSN
jgi:predicted transcriptional regulator of viral defense system